MFATKDNFFRVLSTDYAFPESNIGFPNLRRLTYFSGELAFIVQSRFQRLVDLFSRW